MESIAECHEVRLGVENCNLDRMEKNGAEGAFTHLTEQELNLAHKIFGNYLTLNKILENVCSKTLLNCRLVCQDWEGPATRIAFQRRAIKIRLAYDPCSKTYLLASSQTKLQTLNENVRKRPDGSFCLPCAHLTVEDGQLENPDLRFFLDNFGKSLRILDLDFFYPHAELTVAALRHLLLVQCPNIVELNLNATVEEQRVALFNPGQGKVVLPKLQRLSFSEYFPHISEIIRAAPNLSCMRGDPISTVEALVAMKKVGLAKRLVFHGSSSQLLQVEMLAKARPTLKSIMILDSIRRKIGPDEPNDLDDFPTQRFALALSQTLDSSKDSLEDLHFAPCQPFFDRVYWPTLKNVKNLVFVGRMTSSGDFDFPRNFLSKTFPNLTRLSMDLSPNDGRFGFLESLIDIKPGAEMEGVLPSLTTLLVTVNNLHGSLEVLNKIAPNLEILTVKALNDFPRHAKFVWGFPKLRSLKLGINVGYGYYNNCFPHLDCAFTGIPEKIVRMLENPSYFRVMKNRKIPRGPSMLDCKDLGILKIHLTIPPQFTRSSPLMNSILLSATTGEFGFKQMPELSRPEIRTNVGSENIFESLDKYANIQRELPISGSRFRAVNG